MTVFSLWAPHARRVQLRLARSDLDMVSTGDGWWHLDAPAGPGDDYGYLLDSQGPFPDPRARRQPDGVHGCSRLVAPEQPGRPSFNAPPLGSLVLYELHVGTFTPQGTFAAAIQHLDHLVELGIGALEVMPVAAFPGRHGWGYDGVDLYAVHEPYGGPDGLRHFIDACHQRGLAVVLDVVYNHLGPDGNHLGRFGPYFTDRYATPWGRAINFDGPGSDEVRRFVLDNASMWLEDYRADGLRLDAVHAIVDTSALHILEELAIEVQRLAERVGRNLFLIAESDLNDPRIVTERAAGGYGIDAQWCDDLHHALHAHLTGERIGYYADFGSLADLAKALTNAYVYDGLYSAYRRRRHGRSPAGLPGARFCVYAQNHDQVGNRPQGERLSALLDPGGLHIAAALVLCSPFVPLLFMGEEWGATSPFCYFTDHQDPELARAVSAGRRRECAAFGWEPGEVPDPQDAATFQAARLDWDEPRRDPHARLLAWHQALIAARRAVPGLSDHDLAATRAVYDDEAGWLRLERGEVTVAFNFAHHPAEVPLENRRASHIHLASGGAALKRNGVELEERSVALLIP